VGCPFTGAGVSGFRGRELCGLEGVLECSILTRFSGGASLEGFGRFCGAFCLRPRLFRGGDCGRGGRACLRGGLVACVWSGRCARGSLLGSLPCSASLVGCSTRPLVVARGFSRIAGLLEGRTTGLKMFCKPCSYAPKSQGVDKPLSLLRRDPLQSDRIDRNTCAILLHICRTL
jgi:hypothetical protein